MSENEQKPYFRIGEEVDLQIEDFEEVVLTYGTLKELVDNQKPQQFKIIYKEDKRFKMISVGLTGLITTAIMTGFSYLFFNAFLLLSIILIIAVFMYALKNPIQKQTQQQTSNKEKVEQVKQDSEPQPTTQEAMHLQKSILGMQRKLEALKQ